MTDIHAYPKVELHLHLDCSLSYEAVSCLDPLSAERNMNMTMSLRRVCPDLAEYLKRAPKGYRLMQDKAALEYVVEDLFQQLAADSVIYAELRFAPLLHLEQGLTPEQVVDSVDLAVERMIRETGIEARRDLVHAASFHPGSEHGNS